MASLVTTTVAGTLAVKLDAGLTVERTSVDSRFRMFNTGGEWILASTFGSTGAYDPIKFQTSDVTRLTIAANGAATFAGALTATAGTFSGKLTAFLNTTSACLHTRGSNIFFDASSSGTNVNIVARAYDETYWGQMEFTASQGILYTRTTGSLILGANNAGAIYIVNGGKVGIGTTDPGTYKLYVNGTSYLNGAATFSGAVNISYANPNFNLAQAGAAKSFRMELDGGDDTYMTTYGSGNKFIFRPNSVKAFTIDQTSCTFEANVVVAGSGCVGIGIGPAATLHTFVSGGPNEFRMQAHRNDVGQNMFSTYFSRGTSASPTIVQNGDTLLEIQPKGYDGANYHRAAEIDFQVDGTPGTNDMPGRIMFWTTADGASAPTERMRIASTGNVGIGTTNPGTYKLYVNGTSYLNGASIVNGKMTAGLGHFENSSHTIVDIKSPSSGNMYSMLRMTSNGTQDNYIRADVGDLVIDGSHTSVNITKALAVTGALTGTTGTFSGMVKTSSQFRISADYAALYYYKADDTTMLGYLLMRDNAANFLAYSAGQDFAILEGNTRRLTIRPTTGSIGIGTATPAANLHVEGNSGTHITLRLKNLNTTAGIGAQIQLYDHDSFFYQTIVNGDLRFYNGAEIMILKADGNVGIGTTAPAYKLDVNGAARIVDGISSPAFWFRASSTAVHCWQPKGGWYHAGGNVHTGAIRIKLPPIHDAMVSFWVDVYDYAANESFSAYITGYPYLTGGLPSWSHTSAVIIGGVDRNLTVRFGDNNLGSTSTQYYIYIGETGSTWNHPQVVVRDVFAGYHSTSNEWEGGDAGWGVSFATSFENVVATQSNTLPYGDYNKLINVPASSGVTGTGTANYVSKWTGTSSQGNSFVYETAAGTIGIHAGTNVEGMVDVQMKMNGVDWTYGNWGEVWDSAGTPGSKFNDCVFHLDTDRGGGVTGGIVGLAFSPGWQGHQNWGIYSTNESGGGYTQGDLRFVNQINNATITERVTFKADGKVGIGTTAPSSSLHVNSEISCGTNDDNRSMFGYELANSRFYIGTRQAGTNYFDTVTVKTGKVGIGTTSPATKLEVKSGDVRLTDAHVIEWGGTKARIGGSNSGDYLRFYTNDTVRLEIASAGAATFSGNVFLTSAGDPYLKISTTNTAASAMSYIQLNTTAGNGYLIKNRDTGNSMLSKSLYLWNDSGPIQFITPSSTPRMTILEDGKVGIGSAAPYYKLEVRGTDNNQRLGIQPNTATAKRMHLAYNSYLSGNTNWYGLYAGSTGMITFYEEGAYQTNVGGIGFSINRIASDNTAVGVNPAPKMIITTDGNVGIGTTGPATPLHVWSTSYPQFRVSYNSSLYFTLDHAATLNVYGNDWYVRLNGSEKFRIKQDGKIGIGTNNPLNILTLHQAAGANIRFQNATTGRYFIVGEGVGANDKFSFRGNSYRSTDTLTVDFTNNRVGVANISPGYTLDVNGTFRAVGILYANSTSFFTGATSHTANINMASGTPYITFYGDSSTNHAIGSRNASGNADDDIRINSYGAVIVNLDSNGNNSSGANFNITRHGGSGAISASDFLFTVEETTGKVGINDTAPVKGLTVKWSSSDTTVATGNGLSGGGTGEGLLLLNSYNGTGIYANLDFRAYDADARIAVERTTSGNQSNMHFITDNSSNFDTRMFIQYDGNVGIGTTSPSSILHTLIANSDYANSVTGASLIAESTGSQAKIVMKVGSKYGVIRTDSGGAIAITPHSSDIYLQSAGIMTVTSAGKVFIGDTTASDAQLRVKQSTNNSWAVNVINQQANAYGLSIDTSSSSTTNAYNFAAYTPAGIGFFLENTGRVGIGVAAPSSYTKLHVVGKTYISANTIIGRNQSMNPRLVLSAVKSANLGKADTGMALCIDSGASDAGNSVGHLAQIGLGLINAYQPAAIGAMVSQTAAYTSTHLVFATRPTTTDVAPTERMRIQDDGNVGIGTTTPASMLEVIARASGGHPPLFLRRGATNESASLKLLTTTTEDWIVGMRNDGTSNFRIYSYGASSDVFSINRADGNVGINETSPGAKLTVAGNAIITSNNPLYMGGNGTAIGTWVSRQYATGGDHYLGCNGLQVNNAGYVSPATTFLRIYSTGQAVFTSIASNHNYHYIDTTSGGYNPILGFLEAGTRRAYINYVSADNYLSVTTEEGSSDIAIMAAGKVGVGTTNPENAFEVKKSVTGSWVSRIYNTATTGNPYGLLVRVDKAAAADTHFGVYNGAAHTFAVKGDGNVGIGTPSPSRTLTIDNDSLACLQLCNATTGPNAGDGFQMQLSGSTGYIWNYEAGDMIFGTSSATRLTLKAAGQAIFTGDLTCSDDLYLNATDAWIIAGSAGNALTGGTLRIQNFGELEVDGVLDINGTGTSTFAGALTGTSATFSAAAVVRQGVYVGSFTTASALQFEAPQNGTSQIKFYDNNATEGCYIKSVGQTYGGKISLGARWNSDQDRVVFDMAKGGSYDVKVGIGTDSPTGKLNVGYTTDVAPIVYAQGSEGLVINATRHDGSNYRAYVDFLAGRGSDATNGGASMRFFTQPRSSAAPTQALTLQYDGNVGIGTTAPSNLLHVYENSASGKSFRFENAGGIAELNVYGSGWYTTIGRSASVGWINVNGPFKIQNYSGGWNTSIYCEADGDVGIGDESPSYKLDVNGTFRATGVANLNSNAIVGGDLDVAQYIRHTGDTNTQLRFESSQITIGTSGGSTISLNNDENIYFYSDSTEVVRFSDNNASDPQVQAANGKATRPSYSFFNDIDLGMYRDGADILRFSTAGAPRLSVIANGYVGIGTTNPSYNLEVAGTADNPFRVFYASATTIADFGSSLSTFTRVKINNTSASGDAQLSFQSASSTKWSIGNRGDDESFHIRKGYGAFPTATEFVIDTSGNVGIGTTAHSSYKLYTYGSTGASGSKFFDIIHPDPSKGSEGYRLRHGAVEAPTFGENLYRFTVTVSSDGGSVTTDLPSYFSFLNENPQVWIQARGMFAQAYGEINSDLTSFAVTGEKAGQYDVLVIGSRKSETTGESIGVFTPEYK